MGKPKLIPLKQWVCDSCDENIDVDDGFFEWYREDSTGKEKGFRIVHNKSRCLYDPRQLYRDGKSNLDMNLDAFVGRRGLVTLLSILDEGNIEDVKEWTEVVRRLHVDYYEEARMYWSEAQADGYLDGSNGVSEFLPSNLKELIQKYGR
ncbi:hypothetical protein C161_27458 [Paenibacillus sp. FSL R5-192]|uniref:hypothetical protein n=1 Tax=Paenibacillus sp. FSL R5-192 TaxID=1226754 RepID=UPI0003E25496|nr:hypothetical protein [Paenibacillus sp. FSL R5-192]ETT30437.1 hypothetical protein C161_27458 [Paenibacillus sp. FSL R5-192]